MQPDTLIDAIVAASGHARPDAAVIYYNLQRAGWTLARSGEKHIPKGVVPDFGKLRTTSNGMVLETQAIAPGLSMHDLVTIFERAKNEAAPGDSLAANPSRWPVTRGVRAVTEAVLKAIYGG